MGVSIRLLPECDSARKRRLTSRFPRKLLNAVLLAVVLLLWVVPWTDEDSGVEIQTSGSTEPAVERDLGDVMVGVNNLVIVTCHAIWLGGPTAGENEAEWCAIPPPPVPQARELTSIAGQLNPSRRARQRRLSSTSKKESKLR